MADAVAFRDILAKSLLDHYQGSDATVTTSEEALRVSAERLGRILDMARGHNISVPGLEKLHVALSQGENGIDPVRLPDLNQISLDSLKLQSAASPFSRMLQQGDVSPDVQKDITAASSMVIPVAYALSKYTAVAEEHSDELKMIFDNKTFARILERHGLKPEESAERRKLTYQERVARLQKMVDNIPQR